jgi:hypothetical protein
LLQTIGSLPKEGLEDLVIDEMKHADELDFSLSHLAGTIGTTFLSVEKEL